VSVFSYILFFFAFFFFYLQNTVMKKQNAEAPPSVFLVDTQKKTFVRTGVLEWQWQRCNGCHLAKIFLF